MSMVIRSVLRRAGPVAVAVAASAIMVLAPGSASAAVTGLPSFAGYQTWQGTGYGEPSHLIATTTVGVPKLRCGGVGRAVAPGIVAGYSERWQAALFVGCVRGKAHYWPELEVNGQMKSYRTRAIHPGDLIVLRVNTYSGRVSLADQARDFKVSRTGPRDSGGPYSLIGVGGWADSRGRVEPVPDVGTLTFSNSRVYGQPLGGGQFLIGHALDWWTGTSVVKTGNFFDHGTAFRTYFRRF
jgi:hypothetical protein